MPGVLHLLHCIFAFDPDMVGPTELRIVTELLRKEETKLQ